MINNFEQVKRLLNFESDDDFYFIQVLKRRKDNPDMERDMEVIDDLYVYSMEDFIKKSPSILDACIKYNARAYFRVNRRSLQKTALMTLKKVTDLIISKNFQAVKRAYSSAAGEHHNERLKRWIVDIDTKDQEYLQRVIRLINELHNLMFIYSESSNQILEVIPTKSGYHIICNPFNVQEFKKTFPEIDIHKDNPTVLFIA